MNQSSTQTNQYQNLLNISQFSLSKINELAINQNNVIWRCLLKVQSSRKNNDHTQAINDLRMAKSQIVEFLRKTISQKNQQIYKKVMVCILTNLINRLFGAKRYKQAMEYFKQLLKLLSNINLLKEALGILFGVSSLISLKNYNLQSNFQFKYPAQAQLMLFYMVGKVKLISRKNQDAFNAFKKILTLQNSYNPGAKILVRVYESLSELQPVQYRSQYQKFIKTLSPEVLTTIQEKLSTQQIIRQLLEKQCQIFSEKIKESLRSKSQVISKQSFQLYLRFLIKESQKNFKQHFVAYCKKLLHTLQQQNNIQVIKQVLQQSELSKQATQWYKNKFQLISKIPLKFCFGKIKNSNKENKTIFSNISETENYKNFSKSGQKKGIKIKLPKTPKDLERANQILNKCKQGSIIRKINFGNNSVVQKFARIEQKKFVWGESQKQIEFSSSSCKWKTIIAIVYGKVTDNLIKSKHNSLEPWRCFSLIAQDRSYDFQCQSETDVFFWLQGISYKLQLFHKNAESYPFYSKGRALWKMTLLKAASKYTNPKKKYKSANAGGILQFSKLKLKGK